jgi:hypothetical protein
MNKKNLSKTIPLCFGVFIMSVLVGYLVLAWTEPSQAPPGGNVYAPINVGADAQYKIGGLILNTGGGDPALIVVGEKTNPVGGACPAGYDWYDYDGDGVKDNGECQRTLYYGKASGNVGIGTISPAASSLLDLTSTTKGFLAPRMTTAQRDAISSPATGLLIYNTSTNQYNFYNGTAWTAIGAGGGGTVTSISAGAGLTASPSDPITTSGTLNVGAGTGISVGADSISVIYGSTAGTAAEGNKQITVSAGTGLTGGGTITIGAGGSTSLSLNTAGISTCTDSTTNKIIWDSTNNRLNCATDQTGGGGGGGFTCSPTCTSNYLAKFTGSSTIGDSLIYDNGTNVGIGKTNPEVKLDIEGDEIRLKRTTGGAAGAPATLTLTPYGSGMSTIARINLTDSTGTLKGALQVYPNTSPPAFGFFGYGVKVVLGSGELTSALPLEISQTWNNAGVSFPGVRVNITDSASAAGSLLFNVRKTVGGTSYDYFSIRKDGNVGIGTTDPAAKLHLITSPTNWVGDLTNLKVEAGGTFDTSGTLTRANYGGYFVANATRSAGSPALFNYGVYGYATNGQSNYGVYGMGGETGVYGTGNNEGVFGNSSLGKGVSGYSASGYGVYGWGDAATSYDFYAAGPGINYGSASSIRWKKNIKPIDDALNKTLNLRGVYFDWDEAHGGGHDIGMIGEEVGKVLPEIVVYEKDGSGYTSGMDYSKLTPLLVEAIKEQQKQIENLKTEIETLKTICGE